MKRAVSANTLPLPKAKGALPDDMHAFRVEEALFGDEEEALPPFGAVPVMQRLEKLSSPYLPRLLRKKSEAECSWALYSYASNGSLCACLSLLRGVSVFSAVIIMAEVVSH